EAATNGSLMPATVGVSGSWDVAAVRTDPAVVARSVLQQLSEQHIWIHLDLDVLDESVLPATDYLSPGGLDWPELAALLRPLVSSAQFCGMSVACLNPDKDPNGRSTQQVTDLLVDVLE
ncbi:MAG TPA: arginase family protein, partial [Actinomycetes bacterium]|nr:arginase family protein [Actinomycetes bacterium]